MEGGRVVSKIAEIFNKIGNYFFSIGSKLNELDDELKSEILHQKLMFAVYGMVLGFVIGLFFK